MKKLYEAPELSLVRFTMTDVLSGSPTDQPTDVVAPLPSEIEELGE